MSAGARSPGVIQSMLTSSHRDHADAKTLNGISGPLGYFDPLSLAATAKPADVKRWREAELTHGRVAMLAALGFIVGEAVEGTSLFYNFDGGISGPAIVHFQQTKQGFWEPLVLTIGAP